MAGSLNKVMLIDEYVGGASIPQVAEKLGIPRSTARYHLNQAGVLRGRADAIRLASSDGRLGSGMRGKHRAMSEEHKEKISQGRLRWADAGNAIGVSLKPNGYVEYTRGEHKGRCVHAVMMEQRLGRHLLEDECVHHIDGDKTNNQENNLALLTRSGHTRLHRREERLLKGDK